MDLKPEINITTYEICQLKELTETHNFFIPN